MSRPVYVDPLKKAMQQYASSVNQQLNQPLPFIKMPIDLAAEIEPMEVFIVSKIDGEGMAFVEAVFTKKEDADAYTGRTPLDQYEYFDMTRMKLNSEVFDDVDEAE